MKTTMILFTIINVFILTVSFYVERQKNSIPVVKEVVKKEVVEPDCPRITFDASSKRFKYMNFQEIITSVNNEMESICPDCEITLIVPTISSVAYGVYIPKNMILLIKSPKRKIKEEPHESINNNDS